MSDEGPITQAELIRMFGTAMPVEAINLLWAPLWAERSDMTVGQMRAKLREIAASRDARPIVPVTKADRDAAAEVGERFARWTPEQVIKTQQGGGDGCGMVQAFAKHRIAASADTLPKGRDAKQGSAGTESGAVADRPDAQGISHD